jgi:Ca2+-binding EF-hand superfamily protein
MDAMELHKELKVLLKDYDSKADSVKLWDFCKKVAEQSDSEMAAMLASRKKEFERASVRLTPEERAQELSDMLDEKLKNRELTASELREMKDIFNLKAKDQDIIIQMMDFRAIDPKMADIVKAVQWQIDDANDTTSNKA